MGIEIKECTFEELEADWRRMEEEGVIKLPYLTYDWQYIWWKHYHWRAKKLLLLGAYDHGRLEAIAPLWLREMSIKGMIKLFEIISFIGAREIDYCDFITKNNDYYFLFFDYIKKNYHYAVIYLADIEPEVIDKFKAPFRLYKFNKIEKGFIYPYIKLTCDKQQFINSLGKASRKDIRWQINRLKRVPDFKIEKTSDPKMADIMFNMHYKRWHINPDREDINKLEKYEKDLINTFCAKKTIKFISIYLYDKCIGTIFLYDFNNKRYFHKIGYDIDYRKYSIGKVLIYLSIEDAIENKFDEYDFLRGDEEYKWHFTSQARTCYNLMAAKNRLRLAMFRRLR